MNVMGVYGGIGSMLEGAKNAGCNIVGNIEPRDFEDGSTFLHNFPEAWFMDDFRGLTGLKGKIDLIVGHPSCGSYSAINWRSEKVPRDEVENFVGVVKDVQPKFFIMDNLPKVFIDYNAHFWYHELSKLYDITPVWVNNRFYGNAQTRKRVYIIGSLRELGYVPVSNEQPNMKLATTKDVIGHLLGMENHIVNHHDVDHEDRWSAMTNVLEPWKWSTYRDMFNHVQNWPEGKSFTYHKADGSIGTRIGLTKVRWFGACSTLSSTARQIHPRRCTPLTIKEQLLLMGYNEYFHVQGMKVATDGTWKIRGLEYHKVNKGVCVQSIQHFIGHMKNFFEGIFEEDYTGIESGANEYVSQFKHAYCQLPGVTIDTRKCSMCKMKSICRKAKG